jgi:penicillin amidase
MNRSKEILAALVAVTLLIGFGGGASAAELDGPVSIVYDSYGVPTVVANTEHDAVYMEGYLHAKDRLFQMDFLRHVFQGRVAEMSGPAAWPRMCNCARSAFDARRSAACPCKHRRCWPGCRPTPTV